MVRSLSKDYINLEEGAYILSIVTGDRTLDFELDEVDHGPLVQALLILIEFYQVTLPIYGGNARKDGNYNLLDDSTNILHNGEHT